MTIRARNLLVAASVIVAVFAGSSPVLAAAVATWNLNGVFTTSNPVPVTTTAVDVTAGSLAKSAALTSGAYLDAFVARGWPLTGSADPARYLEFSVTSAEGRAIVFDKVAFSLYNNHPGSATWEIRSSVDGYQAALSSGTETALVGSGVSVQASVAALGAWHGTVTFRVYTYANTGDLDPDQRGFRGAASGGQDLVVHGTVIGPIGVPDASTLAFRLDAVRPNPALHGTVLGFSLPAAQVVELTIFDVHGRRVRTLIEGERAAGEQSAAWDGAADDGAAVRPGVYFAVLKAGSLHASRSVTLVR